MTSKMVEGWFGSSIVGKLINLAFNYAEGQFIWQTGMKAEQKRLQLLLPRVEAVVSASSRIHDLKNKNEALYNWLHQLHDAIDDADDVLDELEYLRIKEQLLEEEDNSDTEAELNQVSYTISSIQQSLIRFGNRALERDPVLLKLKGALENLDRVFSGVTELNQLVDWVKQEQLQQQIELTLNRETGSYPASDLIGHEEDVANIIQWLRSSDPEEGLGSGLYGNISLLSIVGIGGMGKTTLLQHVYHKDDIIKQELHFDCKMWACISNIFDVKRVLSDILESLTGEEGKPNLGSLDAHQRRLNAGVSSKKLLLVLDDAWEEHNSEEIVYMKKWEALLAPLCGGKKGSKILLTTRMESVARLVARTMNTKHEMIWKLKGLEDSEVELLLNRHAFAGIDNINDYPKLKFIANQIARKLHGSPLGAKVIGGALRSNMDEKNWMYILTSSSSIWDAEPVQKGIMSILRLSYDFLPTQLQRCFAFCSIFKYDHRFNIVELVRMWVALGFIQQSDRSARTIDDVGESYFDFLFQRSFFSAGSNGRFKYYVMHDMLHDLAMLVADGKCLSIIGDELDSFSILDNVRHLSISTYNLSILKKIKKGWKRLQSLILHIDHEGFDGVYHEFVCKDLKELKSLRLLQINAPSMISLPDVFGDMIHLRYLDISDTKVILVPKSICLLYHLQVLYIVRAFTSCVVPYSSCSIYQFPKDIIRLTKLRHIRLPWMNIDGVFRIGRLTLLQKLDKFTVKDEDGYRIGELKHMNQLQSLNIRHIENVKEKDEASIAKLADKQHLTSLSLSWSSPACIQNDGGSYLDEAAFDQLQPPKSLKHLTINGYRGTRSAVWMKPPLIINLESINLYTCSGWKSLPPLSQLPFLKRLFLMNMPQVKCLGQTFHGECKIGGFPSLEELSIVFLKSLHGWFFMGENVAPSQWFPRLRQLIIRGCPNLRYISSIPLSLNEFLISNVGILNFPSYDGNISSNSRNFSSASSKLSEVETMRCGSLTTFPSIEVLQRFVALKILNIERCEELISLEGLQALRSLETLNIRDCLKLGHHEEELPPLSQLPFLKRLSLCNLPHVKCLGQKFHGDCENTGFPSLKSLDIEDLISLCDWFQMAEDVTPHQWFPMLQRLQIKDCPNLRDIPSIPLSLEEFSIYKVGIINFPGHDDNISSDNKSFPSASSKLSQVKIASCESMTTFPSTELLQRFVALKVLRIEGCKELISLEGLPAIRSLKSLIVHDCPKLGHCEVVEGTKCSSSSLQILEVANLSTLLPVPYNSISTLQSLKIHRFEELACFPKEVEWWLLQNRSLRCLEFISLKSLKFLPTCLPNLSSLDHLIIKELPLLEKLPELPTSLQYLLLRDLESLHLVPTWLDSLPSLEDLTITKIPSIKTLLDFPCFLQGLKLKDLTSLSSLPSSMHNLTSLKYLSIQKIPLLEELPVLPPFLKYLKLEELEVLQSLPSCLSELSFLLELELTGISQIQILPDLPPSIQVLLIDKPHPVLKERCKRDVGLDWPKIAHINRFSITMDPLHPSPTETDSE